MLSFESFVKSMPPSLSELKVTPSFRFAFKIPDDRAVTRLFIVVYHTRIFGVYGNIDVKDCDKLTYRFYISLLMIF